MQTRKKEITGEEAARFIEQNPGAVTELSWVEEWTSRSNDPLADNGPWAVGEYMTRDSVGAWTDAPGMSCQAPRPLFDPEDDELLSPEKRLILVDRLLIDTAKSLGEQSVSVVYVSETPLPTPYNER